MTPEQQARVDRVQQHIQEHGLEGLTLANVLSLPFDNEASKAAMVGLCQHLKERKDVIPPPIWIQNDVLKPSDIVVLEEKSGVFIVLMGHAVAKSFMNELRNVIASLN